MRLGNFNSGLVWIALALSGIGAAADEGSFQQDLRAVDALRKGLETDFAAVDALGKELLDRYEEPAQQAQIHFTIAHVHAQSGMKHPGTIRKEAQVALDSKLLAPEQRATMYSYICSSYEVDTDVKDFATRRRNALTALLKGLAEMEPLNLPEIAPDLPTVGKVNGRGQEGPGEQAVREAQMTAWRKAQHTKDLVFHRNVLRDQVKWLYVREPLADEELVALAAKQLNEESAEHLLSTVKRERERIAQAREKRKQDNPSEK